MSEQRELTLDEWVNLLPEFHLAKKQYQQLQQHNYELAAMVERLSEGMKTILGWRELRDTSDVPIERIEEVARMALEAAPQQSLAEHDAEVAKKAYLQGASDAISPVKPSINELKRYAEIYAKRIKDGE